MQLPILDKPDENIAMYFRSANEFVDEALKANEIDDS
jgi:hypothetical protein